MKRREFIATTGAGVTGIFASRMGAGAEGPGKGRQDPQPGKLSSIRRDFPALEKFTAYMDTAFIGLMPNHVRAAHEAFLDEWQRFGSFARDKSILGVWMERSEVVRAKLARLLGARPSEMAFTYCTGCGSNIALKGIDWKKGDNAVIDDLEYPTDFHVLNDLKQRGVEIRIARHTGGSVPPAKFEALADRRTRAFVVSHVSYLNGFRHDLKQLADIIHAYGGYLIVDSAQSIGGIKVDVRDEDVDFMSGIPYKWMNGPNGLGFLYVRESLIPAFKPDRLGWSSTHDFVSLETMESSPLPSSARRFEYGTLAFESVQGLDAALDYINTLGIESIEQHNLRLVSYLRRRLSELDVEFYTPEGNRSPILSFFTDHEMEIGSRLKERGIYITARRWGKGQIRISPHIYNTEEDVDALVTSLSGQKDLRRL